MLFTDMLVPCSFCWLASIRGGIRDGLEFEDFEAALTRAALLHYNDFGHSLIYVSKAAQLVEVLGMTA